MIEIENLTFSYGKEPLFKELNLNLEKGKIYGLLGLNGAGKTTLLNLIMSALFPQRGSVKIDGIDSRKRAVEYLRNLFIVPEQFYFSAISSKAFLMANIPLYPYFNKRLFESFVQEFNLDLKKKLNKLSGGQGKRFLLSFALAVQSPILLLDEPTNALDIPAKRIFKKLFLSSISDNSLTIISTHQVADIEGIIDQIIILHKGKIVFNQPIEKINEKLSEREIPTNQFQEYKERILYQVKEFGGYRVILKRISSDEPAVNIETLFNAIIENSEVINTYLTYNN